MGWGVAGRVRARGCMEQRGTERLCPWELCQLKVWRAWGSSEGADAVCLCPQSWCPPETPGMNRVQELCS